jgi:DNA invertase Pin-like site-specific DNA recombinase
MRLLHFLDALAIREIVLEMKKAALYVRVSTDQQTVENQLLVLKDVAQRSGWEIVHIFADEGISGAKGRDKRPGYDCLLKAIGRREVQLVAAWSVDRLGRSLVDLVAFLGDIQAQGCDLYLHQQAIDTSTPSGRMLFQMMGVFAEFERSMITSRILAGQKRAVANGIKIGRPSIPPIRLEKVKRALENGQSIRTIAKATGMSTATVMRVKRSMNDGAGQPVAA